MIWIAVVSTVVAALALLFALHTWSANRSQTQGIHEARLNEIVEDLAWIVPWFHEERNGDRTLPSQLRSLKKGQEEISAEQARVRKDLEYVDLHGTQFLQDWIERQEKHGVV